VKNLRFGLGHLDAEDHFERNDAFAQLALDRMRTTRILHFFVKALSMIFDAGYQLSWSKCKTALCTNVKFALKRASPSEFQNNIAKEYKKLYCKRLLQLHLQKQRNVPVKSFNFL